MSMMMMQGCTKMLSSGLREYVENESCLQISKTDKPFCASLYDRPLLGSTETERDHGTEEMEAEIEEGGEGGRMEGESGVAQVLLGTHRLSCGRDVT